jgi:hypothetical protein
MVLLTGELLKLAIAFKSRKGSKVVTCTKAKVLIVNSSECTAIAATRTAKNLWLVESKGF